MLAVIILAIPGASLAQEVAEEPARAVRRLDFDDDLVEAGFDRGRGQVVAVTRKAKVSSLIQVRKDFIPELLKMAEDI